MNHMHKGNILPIAIMAFAIVAFLLMIDFSIHPPRSSRKVKGSNTDLLVCGQQTKLCPDGTYVKGEFVASSHASFCSFPCPTANTNVGLVACTDEAKLCPDGSYVSRSGPRCEFATCPSTSNTNQPSLVTHSNSNTNSGSNLPDDPTETSDVTVTIMNTTTGANIGNIAVEVYTDNGVRCVTTPCPTNGRTYKGTANLNGQLTIPASYVDESMTITPIGYNGAELHTRGTLQSDGKWILPVTFIIQR